MSVAVLAALAILFVGRGCVADDQTKTVEERRLMDDNSQNCDIANEADGVGLLQSRASSTSESQIASKIRKDETKDEAKLEEVSVKLDCPPNTHEIHMEDGEPTCALDDSGWIAPEFPCGVSPAWECTVHLRGPRDECTAEEMEFLQQPFRVPKKSDVALEQQGPSPAGYQFMGSTACFYPTGTVYQSLADAAAACNANQQCAGIYDGLSVSGQPQGYSQCIAPNHNFGCGSWYQGGYQGTTYWKQNNPYNNECQ